VVWLARGTTGRWKNLYRLGVPDIVIQRILRHANVSTTATYYIKTAAADVRSAMAKLENSIPNAVASQPQGEASEGARLFIN
jgi:integrase